MRKNKLPLLALTFILVGCGSSKPLTFDNNLPCDDDVLVIAEYGNTYSYHIDKILTMAIELEDYKFYSEEGTQIENLLAGDYLDIYYTDENRTEVDHIIVAEATLVQLNYIVVGGEVSFFDETGTGYNDDKVTNVLFEDGSYCSKNSLGTGLEVYGTINPGIEENNSTDILGLYAYHPKGR